MCNHAGRVVCEEAGDNDVLASFVLIYVVGIPVVLSRRRPEADKVSHYIPFGPFLAIGGVVAMFFGEVLMEA